MDLLKAKIYLDKINRELTRMLRDPETIVRIEQDIVLSHIRELYEALLPEPGSFSSPAPPPPVSGGRKTTAHAAPKSEPIPPPVEAPPIQPELPPVPTPPPAPPVFVSPEVPVNPPAPSGNPAVVENLFTFKEAKELSEKLADQPISDLRQAISLNDRLLYTRELFGGDQQAFEHTINVLNTSAGFDQAKLFLVTQCVNRFGWTDKARVELAKKFIKLARRRFF